MSVESPEEALARVRLMIDDRGDTWDLSPNDKRALAYVLGRIAALEEDVITAQIHGHGKGQEDERNHVVAWLRGPANIAWLADIIERGDHVPCDGGRR